jgi:hypothetical protein
VLKERKGIITEWTKDGGPKMNRKIRLSIFYLLTTGFSLVSAQNTLEKPKPAPVHKKILILKDSTELEISVSRIVRDSLTKSGYVVKETSYKDINKEKASLYNITIVFNAIKPGNEIDSRVRKFITTKSDTASKVFIYSVYGNIYTANDSLPDATTQATEALRPQLIASHILRSLKL